MSAVPARSWATVGGSFTRSAVTIRPMARKACWTSCLAVKDLIPTGWPPKSNRPYSIFAWIIRRMDRYGYPRSWPCKVSRSALCGNATIYCPSTTGCYGWRKRIGSRLSSSMMSKSACSSASVQNSASDKLKCITPASGRGYLLCWNTQGRGQGLFANRTRLLQPLCLGSAVGQWSGVLWSSGPPPLRAVLAARRDRAPNHGKRP